MTRTPLMPDALPARRRAISALVLGALALGSRRGLAAQADCGPTGSATAGPFYLRNAPSLHNINRHGLPGTPMRVSGRVLGGADGRQPLADAIVELWHCDAGGHYHPAGSGEVANYMDEEVDLRGLVATDAQGQYHFDSIVPGHYGNRRRHLHWRVVAPGHRPLVTQSYWLDERGSARARRDFVDRNVEDCRWVAFRTGPDGVVAGRFDIVLATLG